MTEEEKKEQYNRKLISYIEGMIPFYYDATTAQNDIIDSSIMYQLLSSIPERLSV
jgi:hypothetical protein